MKEIPLTQGQFALVDDADYDWLMQWKWCAQRCRDRYHAARGTQTKLGSRLLYMHRALLPDASMVDHKDGDGLNNQRGNLRAATHAQNLRNRGAQKNNTSGFKGVFASGRKSKPWSARVMYEGVNKYFGIFATPEEAARAYDKAATQLHGEFVRLNFPPTQ